MWAHQPVTRLIGASPNPFNPVTTIRFDLPRAGHVKLSVFNVKGELVSSLVDGRMPAGQKARARPRSTARIEDQLRFLVPQQTLDCFECPATGRVQRPGPCPCSVTVQQSLQAWVNPRLTTAHRA